MSNTFVNTDSYQTLLGVVQRRGRKAMQPQADYGLKNCPAPSRT